MTFQRGWFWALHNCKLVAVERFSVSCMGCSCSSMAHPFSGPSSMHGGCCRVLLYWRMLVRRKLKL